MAILLTKITLVSIEEWLVAGEEIKYDTSNYDLVVNREKNFRGAVTNKRTIFVTENRMHDVKNSLVTSLSFARRIYLGLLIAGLVVLFVGGVFYVLGVDFFSSGFTQPYSFSLSVIILLITGAVLILIFIFYRPETLEIYTSNRTMLIRGPRNLLKNIINEIRKNE